MQKSRKAIHPLRAVIACGYGGPLPGNWEELECGHILSAAVDGLGRLTAPQRRRCWKCTKGHPVDK